MSRFAIPLNAFTRERAHAWVEKACRESLGMVMEIRDGKRSDAQNAALHGLIAQIIRQRPIHNGIRMDMALWKASFMQALGEEVRFVPTLDGDGVFPIGLSTSALPKDRFSELIEFVLSWCAREGLKVEHFDGEPERKAA